MLRPACAVCLLIAVACGGAAPAPPASPDTASAPAPAPASTSTSTPAPAPAPALASAPAEPDTYEDLGEIHDPATLTPLFTKSTRPSFPKATADEHACWQTVGVTGDAGKDFHALVASCGTPTGSVEYASPAAGKLHHIHDKRDTFNLRIQGGLCYRFFGVADGTIKDLDILIERKNGDLVGDDKTNGPVAIIDSDKPWCMDYDGDYQFLVEVDGPGTGNYVFGVWAKPKKK
jgi:hypothetical protein